MLLIKGKYRNLIIELLVMGIVLAIPSVLPHWIGATKTRNPFYVRMAICFFSGVIALTIFFYFIPPRSLWKSLREFGVIPARFSDVLIGLGYGFMVLVLAFILYILIARPLGFDETSYSYHLGLKYFAHSQFNFIILTIETFMWVLYQEVVFRGYLYHRIRQALSSTVLLGLCMLGIDTLYQLLFFEGYTWQLAVISIVSVVAYIRGKRLIRPIVSNFAFTMLAYAVYMGYLLPGY